MGSEQTWTGERPEQRVSTAARAMPEMHHWLLRSIIATALTPAACNSTVCAERL